MFNKELIIVKSCVTETCRYWCYLDHGRVIRNKANTVNVKIKGIGEPSGHRVAVHGCGV